MTCCSFKELSIKDILGNRSLLKCDGTHRSLSSLLWHCFMIPFPTGLCSSIIYDLVQDPIKSNLKSVESFIFMVSVLSL